MAKIKQIIDGKRIQVRRNKTYYVYGDKVRILDITGFYDRVIGVLCGFEQSDLDTLYHVRLPGGEVIHRYEDQIEPVSVR
jgi:hypothetical protein